MFLSKETHVIEKNFIGPFQIIQAESAADYEKKSKREGYYDLEFDTCIFTIYLSFIKIQHDIIIF